jgi:transposase-like protein
MLSLRPPGCRGACPPSCVSDVACNGTTPKTVLTDIGVVDLAVPRDRNGSFEPEVVRKRQTRLDGFDDRIIAPVRASTRADHVWTEKSGFGAPSRAAVRKRGQQGRATIGRLVES